MARFKVTYTQYSSYEVEAENEQEALTIAYYDFESDMRYPAANTFYDDVDVEEID